MSCLCCPRAEAAPSVQDTYPLESVNGSGNSTSYVYRASDRTVPEVAQELSDQRQPDQISAENTERMFLVYQDEYYHLQQDPNKPEDTLVEVDSRNMFGRTTIHLFYKVTSPLH